MRALVLPCLLIAAATPAAHAAGGSLTVSLGLDYASGNYVSSSSTETWALPLSLKYRTDDWSLRVSTAWLRVQGDGNVTPEGDPLNSPGNISTTEGLGDTAVTFTYALLDERTHPFALDISGKIKFGTASASKFLGTGKNDYTLQGELFKPLGKWTPFLNLGHKWKGDPDFIEYRNVWLGAVGTDFRITPTLSIGGSYDWQQAVTARGSPTSEALLYLNIRLNKENRINLYAVGGFSNASPDWGSGFTYSHRF